MTAARTDIPEQARYLDSNGKRQLRYGKKTGLFIDNEKYPLDWAACGTRSNFRAHLRRGQEPCAKCRLAESDRDQARKKP